MNLYLVRHGETDHNVSGTYYGWTDCDINEKGKRQAEYLRDRFQEIPVDIMLSSSLKRAYHTAEIINEVKGLPITKMDGFREIHFGAWEDKDGGYIKKTDPEMYQIWWHDWKHFQAPQGESFLGFYDRVIHAMEAILKTYSDKNVLLTTHSGAMACLFCYFTGGGPDYFWRFRPIQGKYSHISIINGDIVIEGINI